MSQSRHEAAFMQILRNLLREQVQPAIESAFGRIARGSHVLWQALPLPKTGASGHVGAVQPDQTSVLLDPATGIISTNFTGVGGGLPKPKFKGSLLRSNISSAGVLYWEEYPILSPSSAGSGAGTFGTGISTQVSNFAATLYADGLLAGLGIAEAVFAVWAQRETGGTAVNNNPLNIINAKTDTNLTSNNLDMGWTGPFAKFPTLSDGCAALVAELVNGSNWAGIRAAAGDDAAVIAAIQASPWDAGHYAPAGSLWANYQTWVAGSSAGGTGVATDVASFVAAYTDIAIYNGGYAQCVALANQWMDEVLHTPNTTDASWGGIAAAYQMFANAPSAHWTATAYSAGAYPASGDLVVWDSTLAGSGGAGHVALCVSADAATLHSFDQNWNGAVGCQAVTHTSYADVLGWLHFTG